MIHRRLSSPGAATMARAGTWASSRGEWRGDLPIAGRGEHRGGGGKQGRYQICRSTYVPPLASPMSTAALPSSGPVAIPPVLAWLWAPAVELAGSRVRSREAVR
jgi:hypothetical protein